MAGDAVGVLEGATHVIEGEASFWDILNFAPVIGYAGDKVAKGSGTATSTLEKVVDEAPNSGQARTVFRGERPSRSPDVVFEQGLQPKGTNTDLLRHVTGNQPDTNFIATSLRPRIAKGFAGKNGYIYVIRTKNGVNVNDTLGSKSPFPEQFEVAIPGGVSKGEIIGAFKMNNGDIVGDFIPNPSYPR